MFGGIAPELNQAGLVRVQFQPELPHAVLPFGKEPLRVGTMFESQHRIIRKADHDHVTRGVMPAPVPDPQIENIMQEDVGQQW